MLPTARDMTKKSNNHWGEERVRGRRKQDCVWSVFRANVNTAHGARLLPGESAQMAAHLHGVLQVRMNALQPINVPPYEASHWRRMGIRGDNHSTTVSKGL